MARSRTVARRGYTFPEIGGGGSPEITVTPSTWDFGSTPVGTPVTKIFTIDNPGSSTLVITLPITIVGAEASAFTVTVQPTETSPGIVTLAPGASTTFTVQADADEVSEDGFSADISITNNSSENPKLVAVDVTVAQTYANYMLTVVQPELWMRHRETTGTNIVDSSGNGHDGTLTLGAGSLGEDGFNEVDDAILADGSTTKIAIPSNAALKNTAFTFAFLCKPSGAGEGNLGALACYSDAGDTAFRFNFAANAFIMTIGGATTTGQTITTAATVVTLNEWQWIFGALSNVDKKARIWKGRLGVLTEFTYSTQTAYAGALNGAAILTLLNNAGGSRSWAGLVDESIYMIGEPDTAIMQALIDLKGV